MGMPPVVSTIYTYLSGEFDLVSDSISFIMLWLIITAKSKKRKVAKNS